MALLIPDKATMDIYLDAHADFTYERMERYFYKADEEFILDPLCGIGNEFYKEITENANPSEEEATVLKYLRTASADYAYTLWARGAAVQHTNAGISVARSEHSAPVSDAKLEGIIKDRRQSAELFFERALGYLESNAEDFETWKNSPAYTARRETLIASLAEFERYQYIDRSRRSLMQLRHLVLQGESELIQPNLGENLYALLKAEYQAQAVSETNTPLLIFVQRILAGYALGYHKKDERLRKTAEVHTKSMNDYLTANAEHFPLLPSRTSAGRSFPNDPDSSQFVM